MAALVLVLFLVAGCRFHSLAFRQDQRVTITHPDHYSTVALPFVLEWEVTDFELKGSDDSQRDDAGYFAVFVDASPMPPGEGFEYLARDDESCLRSPDCPDEQYLNDRNVYLTTATSFPVDALRDTRPIERPSARDRHEITIILMNGQDRRIGESAWNVSFFVDRHS